MGDEQDEQVEKRRGSFWREVPILIGVAVLVAVLVRAFVVQTFFIPSQSMEHTLDIDDKVLVNKLVYSVREPRRGEIIVFEAPLQWRGGTADKDFIKRVIGVGGDRVQCCDAQHRITVNGHALDEPYIFKGSDGVANQAAGGPFDITVPPDRIWVMGDHRAASADSLEHWLTGQNVEEATIPADSVVGRAFTLFWPLGRATWLTVPPTFDDVPAP
ncbi:signal peptidase I [Actinoplanes sp. TRM 88003]|uniref:Signal peptidase I n=1 Tax=Paractinoplanes aksuensis TaxID=2939490 RepID=A0ABT1DJQ4_9ACTN|nr:signal peptidase I [Actinoplanes aksuensis]MCO8271062.1 signal peptidase I [Actinoplanes aksuensis]